MLIQQPQVRIVTKQVTLGNGEVVLAYFAVIATAGVPEVRFLGSKPIPHDVQAEPLLLVAARCARVFGECVTRWFENFILPSTSIDLLVHQLARAPSVR